MNTSYYTRWIMSMMLCLCITLSQTTMRAMGNYSPTEIAQIATAAARLPLSLAAKNRHAKETKSLSALRIVKNLNRLANLSLTLYNQRDDTHCYTYAGISMAILKITQESAALFSKTPVLEIEESIDALNELKEHGRRKIFLDYFNDVSNITCSIAEALIYTGNACNNGNDNATQTCRLQANALASLTCTFPDWLDSETGSIDSKMMLGLLLINLAFSLHDLNNPPTQTPLRAAEAMPAPAEDMPPAAQAIPVFRDQNGRARAFNEFGQELDAFGRVI